MEIRQEIKLSQQLHLTPQLIQSIKILQCSSIELKKEIEKELLENPILEEQTLDPQTKQDSVDVENLNRENSSSENKDQDVWDKNDDNFSWEEYRESNGDDFSWEKFLKERDKKYQPTYRTRNEDYDDIYSTDKKLGTEDSLKDDLLKQSKVFFEFELDQKIAELLISHIDLNGFLEIEIDEFNSKGEKIGSIDIYTYVVNEINSFYDDEKIDVDDVKDVLSIINHFDPVGCGASTKIEALLIQSKHYNYPELVQNMIEFNFEDLANRKTSLIKERYGIDDRSLFEVLELIKSLEPIPGRDYFMEQPEYIEPDIYLKKEGDEYVIRLNNEVVPTLKVSNFYKNQLTSNKASEKAKDYIKEHLDRAKNVMKAIEQRKSTIRKVMGAILEFQYDFFENGISHLKPITLKDVADKIDMDESTVSRVTSNKYVETDTGVFRLKYFFSSAVNVSGGDSMSSLYVKDIIKRLIDNENRSKPLSDNKIVNILKDEHNINITRRTVTNYRMAMGILSTRKRKKFI